MCSAIKRPIEHTGICVCKKTTGNGRFQQDEMATYRDRCGCKLVIVEGAKGKKAVLRSDEFASHFHRVA